MKTIQAVGGKAEESIGAGDAENQGPPAPRAEVALLAGTFMDLGVTAVLRRMPTRLAVKPR